MAEPGTGAWRRRDPGSPVRHVLGAARTPGRLPDPRPLGLVEVRGSSMQPALADGDVLLVLRGPLARVRLRPGAVVVLRPPWRGGADDVKRLHARAHLPGGAVGWEVRGDAPAQVSTDSRRHGPVPGSAVVGRALLRVGPAHRRGRVPRRAG